MNNTNGVIGGYMIKKMIEAQEQQMRENLSKYETNSKKELEKGLDKGEKLCYNNSNKENNIKNKKGDVDMKTNLTGKVNERGSIEIPMEILRELGIRKNDTLEFKITNGGNIKVRKDKTEMIKKQIIQNVLRSMPMRTTFFGEDKDERFTVCIITKEVNNNVITQTGIAKCSPNDEWNQELGMAIALLRALKKDIPIELMK